LTAFENLNQIIFRHTIFHADDFDRAMRAPLRPSPSPPGVLRSAATAAAIRSLDEYTWNPSVVFSFRIPTPCDGASVFDSFNAANASVSAGGHMRESHLINIAVA
jgi:hypothetical protein